MGLRSPKSSTRWTRLEQKQRCTIFLAFLNYPVLSASDPHPHPHPHPHPPADAMPFDASEYTFFGKDVVQEVALGGLEDDEDMPAFGPTDNEYQLFNKDASGVQDSLSDIDDLASTFAKLNKNVAGPRNIGVIGDRSSGSFSRETSSASDWAQEADYSNWLDLHIFETDAASEGKRRSSQPCPSGHYINSKPLYRALSYPEQPQQQCFSTNPILIPKSSFTSFPPPGRSPQALPHHHLMRHLSSPIASGPQLHSSPPNLSPSSNPNVHMEGFSPGLDYGGNMPQFGPLGHWTCHPNHFHGKISPLLVSGHQLRQQLLHHAVLPYSAHFVQSPICSSHPLPTQRAMLGLADMRDRRCKSSPKGKQSSRFCSQGSDDSGLALFRSKYMTGEEIESILKVQHAASHGHDPYVDDYYRQARIAKNSSNLRLKHQFCPRHLRDIHSKGRNNTEPLVDSVLWPRALLDVLSREGSVKPLEKEPMVAARITIEDCFSVVLDVDDIDRLLQFNQTQDFGAQLRRRRQTLLEGLASSLRLVDPLGKSINTVEMAPGNDLVFLRLIRLPKGRKLFSRFIQLLFPGGDLCRVVCMAVFRHLRFLFGSPCFDPGAAETTACLVKTVAGCVGGMDLRGLSGCLIAVVCSSEQPPLRPIGSRAGDGATILVNSVLERAGQLLSGFHGGCGGSNVALWQASFDAFFGLLSRYCLGKYNSVVQAMSGQGSACGEVISKEMPMEILRASLRHTDEEQGRLLLEYFQSPVIVPFGGGLSGNGWTGSQSVKG